MDTDRPARRVPKLLGADFVVGAGVTLLAGGLRFFRLNIPRSLIPLDEFYYPVNSLGILRHGADYQLAAGATLPGNCSTVAIEPAFAVHPPVGKFLIGAGMKVFGCNSFGWRVSAALFGTLAVLLVYLIGRRLFRAPWAAGLAAFLVATDGLFFVQSRIAMLDIFLAFFVLLAIWLLIEDRARTGPGHTGRRPWRLASAVAIGLGVATKWSALLVIPILVVLAFAWEIERRRRARNLTVAAVAAAYQPHDEAADEAAPGDTFDPPGELHHEGYEAFETGPEIDPADAGYPAPGYPPPVPESIPGWGPDFESASEPAYVHHLPEPDEMVGEPTGEYEAPDELPGPPMPPWEQAAASQGAMVANAGKPPRGAWLPLLVKIGAIFTLIPMLLYVLAYIPWFASGNVKKADGTVSTARYTPPRCDVIQKDSKASPISRQVKAWACYQREIWDFHYTLKTLNDKGKPSHPYLSRAWSWPWMGRPTSHFFEVRGVDPPCGEKPSKKKVRSTGEIAGAPAGLAGAPTPKTTVTTGTPLVSPSPAVSEAPAPVHDSTQPCKEDAEILGLPNPGLWLPAFFLAIPLCFWWTVVRRDQVAAMLLLLFAPLYLLWLITTRPLFLFYMTPAVPILALMVAHMVHRAVTEFTPWRQTVTFALLFSGPFAPLYVQWLHTGTSKQLAYKIPLIGVFVLVGAGLASLMAYTPKPKRLALAYGALVLALFAYFYPVLAAVYIPDGGALGWRKHMWMQADCGQEKILLQCWI